MLGVDLVAFEGSVRVVMVGFWINFQGWVILVKKRR
jgi:hypothetical protein